MTQKDKVKELVGRGLHSYHTKALQKIDRIEKKNKEQNHKISILTNELDNDYLTKTEEGSVVSLEHSKEGMVYLDELQGNTLVNYCIDGSKELTLNGDIDVEGTFVTTTEGVDNGKVDIMCEGNTLVNLFSGKITDLYGGNYRQEEDGYITLVQKSYGDCIHLKTDMYKPNTTYTLIVDVKENTLPVVSTLQADKRTYMKSSSGVVPAKSKGIYKMTFTTIDDFSTTTDNRRWGFYFQFAQENQEIKGDITLKFILLEGDWTNKEIPPYFEGMKSVGQDDENGHKIEILSQNKNFLVSGFEKGNINNNGVLFNQVSYLRSLDYEYCIPNTEIITSYNGLFRFSQFFFFDKDKRFIDRKTETRATVPSNARYFKLVLAKKDTTEVTSGDISSYANKTTMARLIGQTDVYVEPKMNKKEILLNEPLVGNDTVKDRVVKIGGKLFTERFWETVTLDGTQEIVKGNWDVPIFSYYVPNTEGEPTNFPNTLICDRIKPQSFNLNDNTHYALYTGKDSVETKRYIRMQIPTSIVAKDDLEGFKTWLRNNPVTIAYRLNTPIYEPLEVEPTLNTYNDITHISNNSTIPCIMKIQNTGYNAIIKPSTLYTVALDTNKSGTIGMNLGGVKGTTTNNILTLTTPATLTDDSLRIYGKGIKGSKVRLLEGDKTNWIPSFFEGMKSSFEDKFDTTDNTYKMEVSSINKNIIHLQDCTVENNQSKALIDNPSQYNDLVKSFNGKKVIVSAYVKGENIQPIENMSPHHGLDIILQGGGTKVSSSSIWISLTKGTLPHTGSFEGRYKKEVVFGDETVITGFKGANLFLRNMTGKLTMTNIMLEIVNETEYIPHKHNKIQFSSIEPLRKWDRFVFKDGQLMIERGSKIFVLDGNKTGISYTRGFDGAKDTDTNMLFSMKASKEVLPIAGADGGCSSGMCNILPNIYTTDIATKSVPIGFSLRPYHSQNNYYINIRMDKNRMISNDTNGIKDWLNKNNLIIEFPIIEPTYEEIPYELQKIILEGYENGTLFFDTNIPPTSTVTYAGETPIVKSVRLNKTEVLNNTNDINDNIVPYLMDMDYRIVCLQLQSENINDGVSMLRLFGGTYEMLQRDILSKRYSIDEYRYRLDAYLSANKITNEEYEELGEMLNE